MHTRYYKEYSHNLQRDMEFKVYGSLDDPKWEYISVMERLL